MDGQVWLWYKGDTFRDIFCLIGKNGAVGWEDFLDEVSVRLVAISVTWWKYCLSRANLFSLRCRACNRTLTHAFGIFWLLRSVQVLMSCWRNLVTWRFTRNARLFFKPWWRSQSRPQLAKVTYQWQRRVVPLPIVWSSGVWGINMQRFCFSFRRTCKLFKQRHTVCNCCGTEWVYRS